MPDPESKAEGTVETKTQATTDDSQSSKSQETKPQAGVTPEPATQDGAKSGSDSEPDLTKVPAHLLPVTKKLLDERKALREQLKAKDELLKNPRIARLLAQEQETDEHEEPESTEDSDDGEVTEEQKGAITKLARILGLDKVTGTVSEMRKIVSELREHRETEEYNKAESALKQKAGDMGFDWDNEVDPLVRNWFIENPEYQGGGPKALRLAFKEIFFDKQAEVAERAANLKLIKEQKQKESLSSESTDGKKQQGGDESPKELTISDFVRRRITESGGIKV